MKALESILLPCPKCGEQEARINVALFGLGEEEHFHCVECDAVFSATEIDELIRAWKRILEWVEKVHQGKEEAR